jgi:hypothetical protein
MKRRNFIGNSFAIALGLTLPGLLKSGLASNYRETDDAPIYSEKTKLKFAEIIHKSNSGNWKSLQIGECMGKLAKEFVGIPYLGGTLEGEGPEVCRINFEGLDCVTFFENTLCLARLIKKEKTDFQDLINEIIYTRYRNGKLGDYTSRLHYTADWIFDNMQKKTVFDVTKKFGGRARPFDVYYMSRHFDKYSALAAKPDYVKQIAEFENSINKRTYFTIKNNYLQKSEKHFKTGDIVAITSNVAGLDYAHTGLIIEENGQNRFIHASSAHKKVKIDCPLSEYVGKKSYPAEVTVVRPIFVL